MYREASPIMGVYLKIRHNQNFNTKLVAFVTTIMMLAGCATAPQRPQQSDQDRTSTLGPPEPEQVYGPENIAKKEVVVVMGPGMAQAFAGAGILKSLQESGVEVSALAGAEVGSFVAVAFAEGGSINTMDFRLLQFKRKWVEPRGVVSRFLSGADLPVDELESGLKKAFHSSSLEKLKRPVWVLSKTLTNEFRLVSAGPISRFVCETIVGPKLEGGCLGAPQETSARQTVLQRPLVAAVHQTLSAAGISAPVLWVVPQACTPDQRWFHDELKNLPPGSDDELFEVSAVRGAGCFDFERRSEIVYSAKTEFKRRLADWLQRLGWDTEKRAK